MFEPNESERALVALIYPTLLGLDGHIPPDDFDRDVTSLATMLAAYRAGVLEAPLKRIAELEAENARWVGIIKRREAQLAAVVREAMGHGAKD